MPLRNDFERHISVMRGLKELLSAYEELSVMRIARVRGQVLATRSFREGLFQVFSEVRTSRRSEIEELLRSPRRAKLVFPSLRGRGAPPEAGRGGSKLSVPNPSRGEALRGSKQPREAAVLLSSNQKLSGSITQALFRRFLAHIDTVKPAAVVVVGVVGRENLRQVRPNITFKYFELPGEHAPLREHRSLVRFLRSFDEVNIFYGKFVNVVDQIAATAKLTSASRLIPLRAAAPPGGKGRPRDYLFEPELPAVLSFFDTQVFGLLFQQTVSESSLAILGSRITAMEAATANVERSLNKLLTAQLQARKAARSRKQRQVLAGLSLWGV